MNFEITKHLSKDVYDFLKIISLCASEQNIGVYIVGGAIRDVLLGKKIKDIDLIIDSNAIDFASKLPSYIETKSLHKEFCTVKVAYKDNIYDIATTRKEKYLANGALPTVTKLGVSLEDDVIRRDFTINSLYLKIKNTDNNLSFELIDLLNAKDDINSKTLKVIHKESYFDDPTRIIRGVDFKYRFGLDFSGGDKILIQKTLNCINLEKASINRIKSVFYKTFLSKHSKLIFKEIIENNIYKLISDDDLKPDVENINKILENFKLDSNETAHFYLKVLENNKIETINFKDKLEIYNTFLKFNKANLAYYLYKTCDKSVWYFNEIKDIKLNIKGDDLINLGIAQGRIFKEIFDSLLLEKIKNNSKNYTKEDEINWVKKHYLK